VTTASRRGIARMHKSGRSSSMANARNRKTRENRMPAAIKKEIQSKLTYRHELNLGLLTLRYRTTGLRRVSDDTRYVKYREIFCWLQLGGQNVGAIALTEWQVSPSADKEAFFDEMDSESQGSCEVAEALISNWDIRKLNRYGTILQLSTAWAKSAELPIGGWPAALNHLLAAQFDKTPAMLLLQLPLGRNMSPELIQRSLSVRPLLGWAGEDGWMWRPLKPGVPKPVARDQV
jgi:hypothetical protein